jgi:hypothetical protein
MSPDIIYRQIMEKVEPDLLPENASGLVEKYKDETDDERLKRVQRYQAAGARFEEMYAEYVDWMQTNIRDYQRKTVSKLEEYSMQEDQRVIDLLQTNLSLSV